MSKKQSKQLIKIIISCILYFISFMVDFNIDIINDVLFIIAYLIVGYDIVIKAIKNIIRGKAFDENFLMTVATFGAFFIGEIHEAVAVMLFYQVGELFQSYAVDRSRKSVASLMDIRADYANVIRDEILEKVDPEEVNIDDIILVKPGEKVPLDGIIVEGSSMLNTVALTGEMTPRIVSVDDEIFSGCVNQDGILKIKVNKEFGESTVSKILDLVENASSKKSKSENFISKFAKIYTPIVVILAVILAIIPPLVIKDAQFSDCIYRALSFLVVSCPCALVISIPLSFFGGIGSSAKMGILVKGSNYLEALSKAKIIVCDKTGTLTEGIFKVQSINAIGVKDKELLRYAAYAECFSNHPISISLKEAYSTKIDEKKITETRELSGMGINAKVDNKDVLVGNEKLMKKFDIDYKTFKDDGTIIYIAIDSKFVGTIVIADKIKDDSYKAIANFKKNNIKVIMLTGDKESISASVAKRLDLDDYFAELLPQDKVAKVEELIKSKTENDKLIFMGDGINDAPVLALADIGIAMGGLGSDAAIEAADIVIMTDEPSKVENAIIISKKTMRIVYENIIFALMVKIIILILSALGLATMWWAVFADVGVSIIAIINSLRVLRVKKTN